MLAEDALADQTAAASPKSKRLIEHRRKGGPIAAKAAYLIRDTLKVAGSGSEIPKPIFALFYVDPADPMAGGTGHTLRVCEMEAIPYAFQNSWTSWLTE
jgi:hypothetical protein